MTIHCLTRDHRCRATGFNFTIYEDLRLQISQFAAPLRQHESPARRIDLTLSVASQAPAEELQAGWQEVVAGRKMPRA